MNNIIDSFTNPQFAGELFTADSVSTPLLSIIGGLSGGLVTANEEFPTAVTYDFPAAKQPAISEETAVNAPNSGIITKAQATNIVQIFQETVELTYAKKAAARLISPLTDAEGTAKDSGDELDWHIAQKLKTIARDVEHTFINGKFAKRTSAAEANKTRGLIELCTINTVNANNAALSLAMLKNLYKMMADNGAYLDDMVIFVNSALKQAITELYSSQLASAVGTDRNLAGVNALNIETDFFKCAVVYDKFMPQDTVLIADVEHIAPVFQTIPNKGNLFLEELAHSGASERHQLYGHIGLAHGPAFLHGIVKGVKIS